MNWGLQIVGGPTVIGDSERDVVVGKLSASGNDPWTLQLDIPKARQDLIDLFVTPAKRIIRTAIAELSYNDTAWLRLRPVRAKYTRSKRTVTVELQDRRYNLKRRIAGRIGADPHLNDDLPTDETALGAWVLHTTGSPTIDISPHIPGDWNVFNSVRFDSTGEGPDYLSFTVDVPADPVATRVAGMAVLVFFPAGAFTLNVADLIAEVVATDVDLGEVVDVGANAQWNADLVVPGITQLPTPNARLLPGVHYSLEFRIYFQQGLILVDTPVCAIQEVLSWPDAPAGQRIRDLVARANDNSFGHSDTGIRTTTGSVPDGTQNATRVIYSKQRQLISVAIDEVLSMTNQFTWLELQTSTELLHVSDGDVVAYDFTTATAEEGDWEAQGDQQTDVLSLYAPDSNTYAGERWVVDVSVDGPLEAGSHDYGDELAEAGPYGDYDPRVVEQLVGPIWQARQKSGTEVLDVLSPSAIDAVAAHDIRVGNRIVGLDLDGDGPENFRISTIDIDMAALTTRLQLNREA